MINETEISRLARKYGFKYQFVGDSVLVNSKLDEWLIQVETNRIKPYILRHCPRTVRGCKYHRQHRFYDLNFLFKSIKNHDNYYLYKKFKKLDRINKLLKRKC